MSDNLELIKKEDARIVWNDGDKEELHVYEYKKSKSYRYRLEKRDMLYKAERYPHCGYSGGNCFSDWGKISKDGLIVTCFHMIFDYKFKDLKMCFYEFGKIDDLECMRRLLYVHFPDLFPELSYEDFLQKVYGVS